MSKILSLSEWVGKVCIVVVVVVAVMAAVLAIVIGLSFKATNIVDSRWYQRCIFIFSRRGSSCVFFF